MEQKKIGDILFLPAKCIWGNVWSPYEFEGFISKDSNN